MFGKLGKKPGGEYGCVGENEGGGIEKIPVMEEEEVGSLPGTLGIDVVVFIIFTEESV
jgi:hypothetical protein